MAWTPRSPATAAWQGRDNGPPSFLLKEDGGKLLQENGYGIILEQSTGISQPDWTGRTIPTI